jgi:poly-gamma-glutamate synthesis protein (capsule biosynthesis protein)
MIKRVSVAIILSFCFTISIAGQDSLNMINKFSLVLIGDIMGHEEQIRSAESEQTGVYDFEEVFKYIRSEISEADFAIANFEVTLSGPPYTGYPSFSSPASLAVACKNAGIDCLVTANNHAADRGRTGIKRTINKLDSIGIMHTGTFLDQDDRDSLCPLIIKKKGISLALLNYSYGTNRAKGLEPAIVNIMDTNMIARDLRKAVENEADIIVLFLHWGTEYDTIPSKNQTDLAEYFFSQGVDIIVGSHPHVIQKMVWTKDNEGIKDNILIYSLGNFVSNQSKLRRDGGAVVKIEMERKGESYSTVNAGYYLTWVYTPVVNDSKRFFILPCSKYEDQPEFFNKPSEFLRMKTFIYNSRSLLQRQNINFKEYRYSDGEWILF